MDLPVRASRIASVVRTMSFPSSNTTTAFCRQEVMNDSERRFSHAELSIRNSYHRQTFIRSRPPPELVKWTRTYRVAVPPITIRTTDVAHLALSAANPLLKLVK
jgi:hypothetical protein